MFLLFFCLKRNMFLMFFCLKKYVPYVLLSKKKEICPLCLKKAYICHLFVTKETPITSYAYKKESE